MRTKIKINITFETAFYSDSKKQKKDTMEQIEIWLENLIDNEANYMPFYEDGDPHECSTEAVKKVKVRVIPCLK